MGVASVDVFQFEERNNLAEIEFFAIILRRPT